MDIKRFSFIAGIVFIVIGILGFIPGITVAPNVTDPDLFVEAAYGRLLGLFPVNLVHNLIHMAFGFWAVAASRDYGRSQLFCRASAIIYAVMAVAGLIPGLKTLFGLVPLHSHDIWLHAVIAFATGFFGFVRAPDQLGFSRAGRSGTSADSSMRWS
jgi:hypothetical protein